MCYWVKISSYIHINEVFSYGLNYVDHFKYYELTKSQQGVLYQIIIDVCMLPELTFKKELFLASISCEINNHLIATFTDLQKITQFIDFHEFCSHDSLHNK